MESELRHIPVDHIDRNPENPRVLFRPAELAELQESIRRYGIQVPLSVYRGKNRRFVLIDGERRWRCALKLNMSTVPAIVQPEPNQLDNLLLMFNIHALREQWDLLTIALKLPKISALLTERLGRPPNERELSDHTGLSRGVIRRSRLLKDLPDRYKEVILLELRKPKESQKLTEDFFIEMEKSLKTTFRAFPTVASSKDAAREVLIEKYATGVIPNITEFRNVSKIARASNVEADQATARRELTKLFSKNDYTISAAYEASVSAAYSERGVLTRIASLTDQLRALERDDEELDEELVRELRKLRDHIARLLERQP